MFQTVPEVLELLERYQYLKRICGQLDWERLCLTLWRLTVSTLFLMALQILVNLATLTYEYKN